MGEELLGIGGGIASICAVLIVAILKYGPSKSNGFKSYLTREEHADICEQKKLLFEAKLETFDQKLVNVLSKVDDLQMQTTQILSIVEARRVSR